MNVCCLCFIIFSSYWFISFVVGNNKKDEAVWLSPRALLSPPALQCGVSPLVLKQQASIFAKLGWNGFFSSGSNLCCCGIVVSTVYICNGVFLFNIFQLYLCRVLGMGLSKTEVNLRRLLAAAPQQKNQAKLMHVCCFSCLKYIYADVNYFVLHVFKKCFVSTTCIWIISAIINDVVCEIMKFAVCSNYAGTPWTVVIGVYSWRYAEVSY